MAIPLNISDSLIVKYLGVVYYDPGMEIKRAGDFVETKKMVLMK